MSEVDKNQEYKEFGNRMQWLRDEAGLSQREFAEKLGMPQQTYQGYESGIRKVTLQLLKQFANYFDVSIDFLAGRTPDRKLHDCNELYEKFDNEKEDVKISSDEEITLSLYRQLDEGDKGEIRGEMKGMLKGTKYDTLKKESKNA
jgi:repressor LexA